jgi:sec-independent protein translocase protein TatA
MGLDNPLHIAFLLIVLLLVFGAKRLPEMGRSLGSGMRGFKDTLSGEQTHEPHESVAAIPAQAPAAPAASSTAPTAKSEAAASAVDRAEDRQWTPRQARSM